MSTTPVLYSSPGSQHCRRVLLLIHEADMGVKSEFVDVRPPGMGGENESDAFLELNPNAKVPVLKQGELVLTESNAIMIYLSDLFGAGDLLPRDLAIRTRILAWQFWQAAHLSPTADQLMVENMLKPMLQQMPDTARLAELNVEFHRWARVLDQRLQSHDYLVGDTLTCADLSVAAALMYQHAAQLPIAEHPPLARWLSRMHALDSWQATEPPPMPTKLS